MNAADFMTRYYLHGTEIQPPAVTGDEDRDIAVYEDFVLQDGLSVQDRCTADNTLVTPSAPGGGQGKACQNGHQWLHVAPEPTVHGSTWGWRQVR